MTSMVPEDLLPDSQFDTRPDAPAPKRAITSQHALAHEEAATDLLARLPCNYTRLATRLRQRLSEFRSWQLCPPTSEVRERVLGEWRDLRAQAVSAIAGDR